MGSEKGMSVEEEAIRRYEERKNIQNKTVRKVSKESKEIHRAMEVIQESVDMLSKYTVEIEEDPKKVFELTEGQFDTIRKVIGESEQDHEVRVHDFQVYIVEVANRYFKEWLKEQGIEKNYIIRVRNESMFPSISAVYLEDVEIMQVDLYKQRYGVRNKPLSDEEFVNSILAESKRLENEIDIQDERIAWEMYRRDSPLEVHTKIRDRVSWVFMNKEKWKGTVNKRIQREEETKTWFEVERRVIDKEYPRREKRNKELRDSVKELEPFFENMMYLEEEKDYLY